MITGNTSLLQRSLQAVWHPCTQMKLHAAQLPMIPVARAEGMWLYDLDGKRYFDAISSWWVNLFGHGHPGINAALKDQIDRLEHVMLAGFTHEPVVQLSERLSALTDHHLGHCFYASDGASATEIALKMSFHFWRNSGQQNKNTFVGLQNGYHGETVGALAVTDVALFRDAYAPLLRQAATVPSPDWRLTEAGESAEAYAHRCADVLELYLQEHHAHTAALIIEPLVQCAAGMAMHHPAYLRRVRALCTQFDVHLIADEIAVGFGRTGSMFAHEQAGIEPAERPDFLCLSKGISGGYLPLSVVMTTDTIYQAFYADEVTRGFLHSHSYTGNPLACRAALAVLDLFEENNVIAQNRAKAEVLRQKSLELAQHPRVQNFRQQGMILAFDIEHDDPVFSRRFYTAALQQELLLRPIANQLGQDAKARTVHTVYFMPPYVMNEDEMNLLVSRTLKVIEHLTR